MFDVKNLRNKIDNLKQNHGSFYSNSILMNNIIEKMAADENTTLDITKDGAFILQKEKEFFRLYYYLTDSDNALEVKKYLLQKGITKPVIIDVTGRINSVQRHVAKMKEEDIKLHARYNRWLLYKKNNSEETRFSSISNMNEISCGFAKIREEKVVLNIFQEAFEPYISHVPTKATIRAHIEKNEICTIYKNSVLMGAFCFERLDSSNVHLNVIAISKEYSGLGLGLILYEYVLQLFSENTKFICWIDETNMPSIRMHQALGFSKDEKMIFDILIYSP
ncbi:GNAT family N-acetyltransferase [Anaerocolumna xylanovorans]|uniref:Acetyltransferase (GNAT) family protein n=1 Tax=Anaerocolumna xylanovorans DSM 12503 TaxID=1121345 RepID=A0A1M7YLT9_9FIRM|nr:GNAT family N-acetyltransferase [Anaerocolumna xylanovorans]SHO53568.1 Acetyltransferase (GNAT) family protein [Anaerocolumna xylanovorans DSM 12503]